jgi:hypothetical protein
MDRAGVPHLVRSVPRGLTRAALTLLRGLYEEAALPPAADGGMQLLLADVLSLARAWGFPAIAEACVFRFASAPHGRLAWPVATRLAAMVAGGGWGEGRGGGGRGAGSSTSTSSPRALPPEAVPLYTVLQDQAMATAAVSVEASEGEGEGEGAPPPPPCPPPRSPGLDRGHQPPPPPLLLPVGLDLDFVLDTPALRAAWVALPPMAVLGLLSDARCAAGSENSAIAAAALWVAGGLEGDGPPPTRPAPAANPPAARARWAPVLATCLRPERATPLYAAALPSFAPWALGTGGGGGKAAVRTGGAWVTASAPRAAQLTRPPSAISRLDIEYSADAASVAGLVSAGAAAAAPPHPPHHPPPPPPLPSAPRFFRGLFWHLSVEPCQSDASKAGLFLHATYPPAAPGLAAAVSRGRLLAAAAAGGAEMAGLLPQAGSRPPAGAAWVITQRPASASVAPLRLAMAAVWPATTSYGLAGIRVRLETWGKWKNGR